MNDATSVDDIIGDNDWSTWMFGKGCKYCHVPWATCRTVKVFCGDRITLPVTVCTWREKCGELRQQNLIIERHPHALFHVLNSPNWAKTNALIGPSINEKGNSMTNTPLYKGMQLEKYEMKCSKSWNALSLKGVQSGWTKPKSKIYEIKLKNRRNSIEWNWKI